MSNNRYYHVVTERPMDLHQIIMFDETNLNGVATRVSKVEILKKNITYEKLDDMDQIILKDIKRWSDISDRELALEKVRKIHYKDYPSRMASLYVSTSLDDAYNWAKYFIKIGRKTFQIVELECNGNSFTGDAHNCWYGCLSEEDSLEKAYHYWDKQVNIKNEKPIFETIIDGKIKVVRVIKTF